MGYVALACRCMLGLVFVASVVGKMRGREAFADFVRATDRLGPGWVVTRVPAGVLAGGVLAAEAAVPVLLTLPETARAGFVLAGLLALAFTVTVLAALRRRDGASCNCFGVSTRPVGGVHLVRNVALAASAALGLAAGAAAGPLESAGVVTAVVGGVVAAAVMVTSDDLADLFRPGATPHDYRPTKGLLR